MSYGWLTNQVFSGLPGGNVTGACPSQPTVSAEVEVLFRLLLKMGKAERNARIDQMMEFAKESPSARELVYYTLLLLDEALEDEDPKDQEEDKYEEIKNLTEDDRKDIYDYAMERSKILLEDKNDRE